MKKIFPFISIIILSLTTSCSNQVNYQVLSAPYDKSQYSELTKNKFSYETLINSTNSFANKFMDAVYEGDNNDNLVISPISIYTSLALSSAITNGNTKSEILSALGVDYNVLLESFDDLYFQLNSIYEEGMISLSNSLWINQNMDVEENCLDILGNNFLTHSFYVDFVNNTKGAIQAIHDFVFEKTNGLIDKYYALDSFTSLVILNTLYLKDTWNIFGEDLNYTNETYSFVDSKGNVTNKQFISPEYNLGRTYDNGNFKTFYSTTENGFKIDFIVPNDGYSIEDVFNKETLDILDNIEYTIKNDEEMIRYNTSCVFPEFHAEYDQDIKGILCDEFNIVDFFSSRCDLSSLTNGAGSCSNVIHTVDLTVDKSGVLGAAVTAQIISTSAGSDGYTDVYEHFVVDKSFGYVISKNNIKLFCGVINNI